MNTVSLWPTLTFKGLHVQIHNGATLNDSVARFWIDTPDGEVGAWLTYTEFEQVLWAVSAPYNTEIGVVTESLHQVAEQQMTTRRHFDLTTSITFTFDDGRIVAGPKFNDRDTDLFLTFLRRVYRGM